MDYKLFDRNSARGKKQFELNGENWRKVENMRRDIEVHGGYHAAKVFDSKMREVLRGNRIITRDEIHGALQTVVAEDNDLRAHHAYDIARKAGLEDGRFRKFENPEDRKEDKQEPKKTLEFKRKQDKTPETNEKKNVWDVIDKKRANSDNYESEGKRAA